LPPLIRPFDEADLAAVVRLSLPAWAPNFVYIEQTLGSELFRRLYPHGIADQLEAVESVCTNEQVNGWIADVDDASTIGFVAVEMHHDTKIGEIFLLAVDPDFQHRGVGVALCEFALERSEDGGMKIAMVETGDDPGHEIARHTYERTGFTRFPSARYWRAI
jgi:ribosomal protein S18 acetylase RimI-like enzyme